MLRLFTICWLGEIWFVGGENQNKDYSNFDCNNGVKWGIFKTIWGVIKALYGLYTVIYQIRRGIKGIKGVRMNGGINTNADFEGQDGINRVLDRHERLINLDEVW